jgi:hypothetical protein
MSHDNQRTEEEDSSDQVEEADLAKTVWFGKVLGVKCDLEEPTPPSKRLYAGAPCRACEKEATYQEEDSTDQQ